MTYCSNCKTIVSTRIMFDKHSMAYLECKECLSRVGDDDDGIDDDDDYEDLSFMNDFGDN